MERNSFWYLKQFLDAVDNEDLTYEEKCRATYTLCYYGIKGEFPPEAGGYEKMYAKSNEKLFEGQDSYKEKQSDKGRKGEKSRTVSDEEIREAYAALYFELGHYPTESEVIQKTGADVQRLGGRKVWKEDRKKWIEMYRSKYDIQNPIQDEHVYTYTDF